MKYFTYHYMNPRNKQYNDRDVGPDPRWDDSSSLSVGTAFDGVGSTKWDSNAYGYNINELANFFERIDYVIYHGNKAVQYSLINPVLTRFRTGDIDYATSIIASLFLSKLISSCSGSFTDLSKSFFDSSSIYYASVCKLGAYGSYS
jgi:hypothetical protein